MQKGFSVRKSTYVIHCIGQGSVTKTRILSTWFSTEEDSSWAVEWLTEAQAGLEKQKPGWAFGNNSQSSVADWARDGLLPPPQSESTTLPPPRRRRPQPRSCLHRKATRIRTWSDWEDSCHLQGHTTRLWPVERVPCVLLVRLHNPRDWTLPCSSLR